MSDEKNRRIAVEVFRWNDLFEYDPPGFWPWKEVSKDRGEVAYIPDFCRVRSAALVIVDRLTDEGWEFYSKWRPGGNSLSRGWSVSFDTHIHGGGEVECRSGYGEPTMSVAIVEAALKTWPHRKGGKKA